MMKVLKLDFDTRAKALKQGPTLIILILILISLNKHTIQLN